MNNNIIHKEQADVVSQPNINKSPAPQTTKQPWYENRFIVVLLVVFCFPIGIIALIMNRKFKVRTKVIIAGLYLLFYIIIGVGQKGDLTNLNFEFNALTSQRSMMQVARTDDNDNVRSYNQAFLNFAEARGELLDKVAVGIFKAAKKSATNITGTEWGQALKGDIS